MVAVRAGSRAPARRFAGTRVGPFRLERYLGGGGDTEVWRASGDGIVVAVKLRRGGVDDPLSTARLAREAAVLRQVHHPALIGLFDAGEDDGEPYLAFVFHDGPTVAECIDDGRLPAPVAAAIFAPVADALTVLHRQAIVHRDVKPANVLLTTDGPLLIDAGHASIAGSTYDGWVDAAPALAGTTAYLAPESAAAAPAPALDVYALGVSVIEAVTGRASAAAATDAPEAIAALLQACVVDDPTLRPSAAAVADALRTIARDAVAPRERTGGAGSRGSAEPTIDLTAPEPEIEIDVEPQRAADLESGRATELTRLDATARDGALADELRAVLVTAPAGTGKSWLVDAAASRTERAGGRVVRAACSPARGDVRVVASWLLELGRDADGAAELARVAGPAPGAALLRAVGLVRGGEGEVDPAVVADAMAAVLAHTASADHPIICVVEDLHHASLELLDLLSRLAMRPGIRGALWCTTRPNWVDADDLGFEVLALGPLPPAAITALVADLRADAPNADVGVFEEIRAVAGGNPLHAREAALALQRGESLDVHSSLPELIAARFASFEPSLQDALCLAAACGDDFWPEALGQAFLSAVPDLYRAGVAQARMSSLLTTSTEARFRHPLLREVAYAGLDESRRRQLHGELGHALDVAGAPAELVASQAGTAFRLGDGDAARLAARAAADAGREALDRFSLHAAGDWIALLRETGAEREPGLADLLDTELALDRGEYERARDLVGSDPDSGPLAGRRLALATRAAYGTGELTDAARYGERALTLLQNEPLRAAAHIVTYGMVLSRSGRHAEALTLLDGAADDARSSGERALAARLTAEAAEVSTEQLSRQGAYFSEAISRARNALGELRLAGDRRRYLASIPAFVATLYIDSPEESLELAVDGAHQALEVGDLRTAGTLAIAICDTALEAEAVEVLNEWLPRLKSFPLDATREIEADALLAMARAASSETPVRMDGELLTLADRFVQLGEVDRAETPEDAALCTLLWQGQAEHARSLFARRVRNRHPPQMQTLYELILRALEGRLWSLDGLDLPVATLTYYDRALLHLLRGEQSAADTLFRQRYRDRRRVSGTGHQRFSPYFPGALVAALGPPETEPQVEWLLGWLHEPPFPGLWIAHRAICALLLSERSDPPERGLAQTAIELIESTDADPSVRAWITERARRSGA